MKTTFHLTDPDNADATLTITMRIRDWKNLKEQINSSAYPGWKINGHISEVIQKAFKSFQEVEESD